MVRAIDATVSQHVEDLAALWNSRREHTRAGHVALRHLHRLDGRIAGHLDGCLVAGRDGLERLTHASSEGRASALFASAVVALESQQRPMFERCVAVIEAIPEGFDGVA